MTERELREAGFEFYCFHLLCRAVSFERHLREFGETHFLTETVTPRVTLYLIAFRRRRVTSPFAAPENLRRGH